jgi:hypothetical protein
LTLFNLLLMPKLDDGQREMDVDISPSTPRSKENADPDLFINSKIMNDANSNPSEKLKWFFASGCLTSCLVGPRNADVRGQWPLASTLIQQRNLPPQAERPEECQSFL